MNTFEQLSSRYTLRPIRNCPGRFIIQNVPADLAPGELLAVDDDVHAFDVPAARDTVLVACLDGGGLISYRRPDGTHLHTLNNPEGFERKLAELGIELTRNLHPRP